jgi:PAS domain S-box-containing protein
VPGIIYVLEDRADAPGFDVTYVSGQIRALLGAEPEAWTTDRDWVARVHPDDRERVVADIASPDGPWSREYRMLHADGHAVWVRDTGRVLEHDGVGRARVLQGLVVDITGERSAARERESRSARDRAERAAHLRETEAG